MGNTRTSPTRRPATQAARRTSSRGRVKRRTNPTKIGSILIALAIIIPGLIIGNLISDLFSKPDKKDDVFNGPDFSMNVVASYSSTARPKSTPTNTPRVTATPTAKVTAAPTATGDYFKGLLKNGDRGEEVKKFQTVLIELGLLSGKADGIFGDKTEAALIAFQQAVKIPATGELDYYTWRHIYSDETKAMIIAKPTKPPEKKQDKGDQITVYLTATGECYHHASCGSVHKNGKMKDNLRSMTLNQAISKGYVKCDKCYDKIASKLK